MWQQLRRRRVTRTVVTYLAVGFAVLESVWYFVPRLGLVEDVARVVMGIVVLGFPFAVVLAWTYDLTPKGIVRTPEDETSEEAAPATIRRAAWLLLCAAAVTAGLTLRYLRN